MKKNKIFFGCLVTFALLTSAAAADTITKTDIDKYEVITISGTADECKYGDSVGIMIVKPNESYESIDFESIDFEAEDLTSYIDFSKAALVSYGSYPTDKDGVFTAESSLEKSVQGDHIVFVTNSKSSEVTVKRFYFAPLGVKKAFISEVGTIIKDSAKTSSDLYKKLAFEADENAMYHESYTGKMFGISEDSIIFDVSQKEFSSVLYSLLTELNKTKDVSKIEPKEFVEQLELAAKLRSLSEGKSAIFDYKDEFSLDEEFVKTYGENVSKSEKEAFTKYFTDKEINSVADVKKLFSDSVIISILGNVRGWVDYEVLIERHGDYIGISMDKYEELKSPSMVTNYLKASYSNVNDFKTDVNNAITTLLKKQNTSSGGSSGSGGGGGGGGKVTSSAGGAINQINPSNVENEIGNSEEFTDIEAVSWAKEYINYLAAKGIVGGTGDGKFEPMGLLTREQLVKMVVLCAGLEPKGTAAGFEDVDANEWYATYIASAKASGLVNGVSETSFGIGTNVTRQDAAVMLYRAAKAQGIEFSKASEIFADDEKVAAYAKEAVYALKEKGIIGGREGNVFAPGDTCTRAEAAKMIYGIMMLIAEK